MTRQDWMIAGVAALLTAALAVVWARPLLCWAEDGAVVTIPALPPAQLTIPEINAQVSASTTPRPGQDVEVALTAKLTPGGEVREVPVAVNIYSTTMDPLARSLPAPRLVTQVNAVVPVGPDGNGSITVALPSFRWGEPVTPTSAPAAVSPNQARALRVVTTYQMVLSSPLGGQPAPRALPLFTVNLTAVQQPAQVQSVTP